MTEPEVKELDQKTITILIPECCREGLDSCTHTVTRELPKKGNIAL